MSHTFLLLSPPPQVHLLLDLNSSFACFSFFYLGCSCSHHHRLRDAHTYSHLRALRGHTRGINDIAFSADSRYIASASDDNTAIIWSVTKVSILKYSSSSLPVDLRSSHAIEIYVARLQTALTNSSSVLSLNMMSLCSFFARRESLSAPSHPIPLTCCVSPSTQKETSSPQQDGTRLSFFGISGGVVW